MFLRRGVPTGTGGTYTKQYIPRRSFDPFLCIPKDVQEGGFGFSCQRFFQRFLPPERLSPLKGPFDKDDHLFESLPKKGNEGR
jgi:hypothetical protein